MSNFWLQYFHSSESEDKGTKITTKKTWILNLTEYVNKFIVNSGMDIVILKQMYMYYRIEQRSKFIDFLGSQASCSERK